MSRPVVFRSGRSALKVEDSAEVWRGRAGSLVESGMTVNAWCEENRVRKPASHRWLRRFRDEGPGLFGGFEAAHAGDGRRNWYEAVRRAAGGAIVPAAEGVRAGFVEVEVEPALVAAAGGAVAVDLRTMTALVGAGADEGALRALLRAAASL